MDIWITLCLIFYISQQHNASFRWDCHDNLKRYTEQQNRYSHWNYCKNEIKL